ncbi:MAG: hypothetical protein EOM11_03725 [Erysipelotrichia bacterium]|nr:hypothetical protein [Erysipelotrichia bacterium]
MIKGLEGFLIAFVVQHVKGAMRSFAYLLGLVIMVLGYYLADTLLFGYISALGGVGFNFMQGVICCIVACIAQFFFVDLAKRHFIK